MGNDPVRQKEIMRKLTVDIFDKVHSPDGIDDWGPALLRLYSWGIGIAVCTPGDKQLEILVDAYGVVGTRDAHADLRKSVYTLDSETGHKMRPNWRADLAELKKTEEYERLSDDLKYLLAA